MFFDGTETIPEWYRQEQMKHAQLQWAQHQQGTLNPPKALTEEDVRRIVREEIRAALSASRVQE